MLRGDNGNELPCLWHVTDEEPSLGYELATIRDYEEWTGHVNAVILRPGPSDRVIKANDDGQVGYEIEQFGVLDLGFVDGALPEWLSISDEFDSPAAAMRTAATSDDWVGRFEFIAHDPSDE